VDATSRVGVRQGLKVLKNVPRWPQKRKGGLHQKRSSTDPEKHHFQPRDHLFPGTGTTKRTTGDRKKIGMAPGNCNRRNLSTLLGSHLMVGEGRQWKWGQKFESAELGSHHRSRRASKRPNNIKNSRAPKKRSDLNRGLRHSKNGNPQGPHKARAQLCQEGMAPAARKETNGGKRVTEKSRQKKGRRGCIQKARARHPPSKWAQQWTESC